MRPESIVLSMAQMLRRLELDGSMSHQQAVLMLTKLCLELCGTYSHDAFCPNEGPAVFGIPPRLRKEQLVSFLEPKGREQGLVLAREAASLCFDLSGSPQESFVGPALFFDTRYGGLDLCDYKANVPLDLTPEERAAIGYRTITPDFQLVGYNSVLEYLGSIHEQGDNPRIDHTRSLDYQTLGKREFGLWYEDVDTLPHFMASASRLVNVIEQHDGPAARKRFQRLCDDPGFREKQRILASVFCPWMRRRNW